MSPLSTLVIAGRLDNSCDHKRSEKYLLNGILTAVGKWGPSLENDFDQISIAAEQGPAADREFGLTLVKPSGNDDPNLHLLRVLFNPTTDQLRAALKEALLHALGIDRLESASQASVGGRVSLVYTGQVVAPSGEWLLADAPVSGHHLMAWLDSDIVATWRPQVAKFPNLGDRIDVHVATPLLGSGWPPVDKSGSKPVQLKTLVDVRTVELQIVMTSCSSSSNQANSEGLVHFASTISQLHSSTILPLSELVSDAAGGDSTAGNTPILGLALAAHRPSLYVFPTGAGGGGSNPASGLFSLQGFTLLIGASYVGRSPPQWWRMARHLSRLDAVVLPDWSAASILGHQFLCCLPKEAPISSLLLPPPPPPPSTVWDGQDQLLIAPTQLGGEPGGPLTMPWLPTTGSSSAESTPGSVTLYAKLGWGSLRLQPLSQRAGLLLQWSSVVGTSNPPPLCLLLPANCLHGGGLGVSEPSVALARLVKALSSGGVCPLGSLVGGEAKAPTSAAAGKTPAGAHSRGSPVRNDTANRQKPNVRNPPTGSQKPASTAVAKLTSSAKPRPTAPSTGSQPSAGIPPSNRKRPDQPRPNTATPTTTTAAPAGKKPLTATGRQPSVPSSRPARPTPTSTGVKSETLKRSTTAPSRARPATANATRNPPATAPPKPSAPPARGVKKTPLGPVKPAPAAERKELLAATVSAPPAKRQLPGEEAPLIDDRHEFAPVDPLITGWQAMEDSYTRAPADEEPFKELDTPVKPDEAKAGAESNLAAPTIDMQPVELLSSELESVEPRPEEVVEPSLPCDDPFKELENVAVSPEETTRPEEIFSEPDDHIVEPNDELTEKPCPEVPTELPRGLLMDSITEHDADCPVEHLVDAEAVPSHAQQEFEPELSVSTKEEQVVDAIPAEGSPVQTDQHEFAQPVHDKPIDIHVPSHEQQEFEPQLSVDTKEEQVADAIPVEASPSETDQHEFIQPVQDKLAEARVPSHLIFAPEDEEIDATGASSPVAVEQEEKPKLAETEAHPQQAAPMLDHLESAYEVPTTASGITLEADSMVEQPDQLLATEGDDYHKKTVADKVTHDDELLAGSYELDAGKMVAEEISTPSDEALCSPSLTENNQQPEIDQHVQQDPTVQLYLVHGHEQSTPELPVSAHFSTDQLVDQDSVEEPGSLPAEAAAAPTLEKEPSWQDHDQAVPTYTQEEVAPTTASDDNSSDEDELLMRNQAIVGSNVDSFEATPLANAEAAASREEIPPPTQEAPHFNDPFALANLGHTSFPEDAASQWGIPSPTEGHQEAPHFDDPFALDMGQFEGRLVYHRQGQHHVFDQPLPSNQTHTDQADSDIDDDAEQVVMVTSEHPMRVSHSLVQEQNQLSSNYDVLREERERLAQHQAQQQQLDYEHQQARSDSLEALEEAGQSLLPPVGDLMAGDRDFDMDSLHEGTKLVGEREEESAGLVTSTSPSALPPYPLDGFPDDPLVDRTPGMPAPEPFGLSETSVPCPPDSTTSKGSTLGEGKPIWTTREPIGFQLGDLTQDGATGGGGDLSNLGSPDSEASVDSVVQQPALGPGARRFLSLEKDDDDAELVSSSTTCPPPPGGPVFTDQIGFDNLIGPAGKDTGADADWLVWHGATGQQQEQATVSNGVEQVTASGFVDDVDGGFAAASHLLSSNGHGGGDGHNGTTHFDAGDLYPVHEVNQWSKLKMMPGEVDPQVHSSVGGVGEEEPPPATLGHFQHFPHSEDVSSPEEPQSTPFDPVKAWGAPQGLPTPVLPQNGGRTTAGRTTAGPQRPNTAPGGTRSTPNRKESVVTSLPPGPAIYLDVMWVPGYLARVPYTLAVEFFARVRCRIYIVSGEALHPLVGEAMLAGKAKWAPTDVNLLCSRSKCPKQASDENVNSAGFEHGDEFEELAPGKSTITILPTDEPYDWACWLRTPCGRATGETGEARLAAGGFTVLPSASLCDIDLSAGQVSVRCEGVRVEF